MDYYGYSYELRLSFGSVIKYLENSIGIQKDESFLSNYFKFVSRKFNIIEDDSSDKIIKLKKSIAHEMGVSFEHLRKNRISI